MEERNMPAPLKKLFKEYNKKNKLTFTIAGIGLVIFLIVVLLVSFGGKFGILFPKPFSRAANNTETGPLRLSATFNSIGIELPFIGDDNGNATATVEFRKEGDSEWRKGLDLWRTTGAGDGLLANASFTEVARGNVAGIVNEAAAQVPSPTPTGSKDCSKTSVGFTPINDLRTGTYQSFQGGLYPNGTNEPPSVYLNQGLEYAGRIAPINGKIVLLTVGMSNTSQESINFQRKVTGDPSSVNPNVVVINGAQAGWDAEKIKKQTETYFATITTRLTNAGLSADQVQAVWLKEAIAGESSIFPIDAQNLKTDLEFIVSELRTRYPNLQIIYLSSRIYGGYAQPDKVSPEPFAYQGGFAYKWLIEDRINGANTRPWLAWGPYIWADGLIPRFDGLIWTCDDLEGDGIHPATSGENKVGQKLLDFFKADSTAKKWFLADGVVPSPSFTPAPSATPSPTVPATSPTPTPVPSGTEPTPTPVGTSPYTGAFYGSLLQLDQNTNYEIKITLSDIDGVSGNSVINGSIRTREDNIAAAILPTRFVKTGGDDSKDGTTEANAWQSLEKAVTSASAGAVVQVGPGYFKNPTSTRTSAITLKAQFPALDDNRSIINSNNHTVIEPILVSSPTGSSGPNPGVWQKETLTGPGFGGAPPGVQYDVWKWVGAGSVNQLGYAYSRVDLPKRVAKWDIKGPDITTPAGWAEKVYTNQTHNSGFTSFGSDLYLILPSFQNPNNLYLAAGVGNGFSISGDNVRISGFEIRQFKNGVAFSSLAHSGVVDHNIISGSLSGVQISGDKGKTPNVYGSDHVIEYNLLKDSNLWTDNPATDPAYIVRTFIKSRITNFDGTEYSPTTPYPRIGQLNETAGVWSTGGAHNVVVRSNTIDGPFNGVGDFNAGYDRYATMDQDIHDNLIKNIADDAFEPEGKAINWRVWNNRIETSFVVTSIGPLHYGPFYLFRNTAWKTKTLDTSPGGPTGNYFKYSGSSSPNARVYVINNTFWTDQPAVDGSGQYAGGGPDKENLYLRNNIFRTTRYAFQASSSWNESYNNFVTSDTTRGYTMFGNEYHSDVAKYRSDYLTTKGQPTTSNIGWITGTETGGFINPGLVDGALISAITGNLGIKTDSPFIDAGEIVPNISDLCGVNFNGGAPDLGAKEGVSGASCPVGGPSPSPTPGASGTPVPTATPTPRPSPTPSFAPAPTNLPTPSPSGIGGIPTPTPIACSITSASWTVPANPVEEGTTVSLNVSTTGNCVGKQVAFQIRENDSLLSLEIEGDGTLDDDARVQPANASVEGEVASTTWIAEYAQDGLLGTADPPEYFFNAKVVGEATPAVRSSDPLLSVNKSAANFRIDSGVSAVTTESSAIISWTTSQPGSSQVTYSVDNIGSITPTLVTSEIDTDPRVIEHTVTLSNLNKCTKYYDIVTSKDSLSNQASATSFFETRGCTGNSAILSEITDFIRSVFGGTIELLDSSSHGLEISVPNLFTPFDAAFFQVKQLEKDKVIEVLPPPSSFQTVGNYIYRIDAYQDPDSALNSFNKALTVTINYSSEDVAGIDESTLKIHRYNIDTQAWEALDCDSPNTQDKTITCRTDHFSNFALFGTKKAQPSPWVALTIIGLALLLLAPLRKYQRKYQKGHRN